jgi:hypothetical protein
MSTAFYPLGMRLSSSSTEGYVSWKGDGQYSNPTSITSGNIRPLTNNDPTNNTVYKHGLPRPIKHYRRGTIAPIERKTGGHVSIRQAMETPGGFIQSSNVGCETPFYGGNTLVSEWSPIINLTMKPQPDKCVHGGEVKKALSRTRTASTVISKKYFQTSAEHLYNRCSTFDQAESHYNSNNTGECGTKCENLTVYKPSNQKFAQQGAVSSSTRLIDLQRNAIEKGSSKQEIKNTPCIVYRRKR